ncbi:MAG: hypothetical protein K8R74_13365 [Bacteroidales bacterium]|nr:hypothetical protein [Bacteroidales bacterium]
MKIIESDQNLTGCLEPVRLKCRLAHVRIFDLTGFPSHMLLFNLTGHWVFDLTVTALHAAATC